jgi:hypothetical protein
MHLSIVLIANNSLVAIYLYVVVAYEVLGDYAKRRSGWS